MMDLRILAACSCILSASLRPDVEVEGLGESALGARRALDCFKSSGEFSVGTLQL